MKIKRYLLLIIILLIIILLTIKKNHNNVDNISSNSLSYEDAILIQKAIDPDMKGIPIKMEVVMSEDRESSKVIIYVKYDKEIKTNNVFNAKDNYKIINSAIAVMSKQIKADCNKIFDMPKPDERSMGIIMADDGNVLIANAYIGDVAWYYYTNKYISSSINKTIKQKRYKIDNSTMRIKPSESVYYTACYGNDTGK